MSLTVACVAKQPLVGAAGEDRDRLDPNPQVHGSEPTVQPRTRELMVTSGPHGGAAVTPSPHLWQQPCIVKHEHERLLVTPPPLAEKG